MKDQEFIKISQPTRSGKVVGSLSVWQLMPIAAVALLIYLLCQVWKFNFFTAFSLGAWLLATTFLLTGNRPDRFLRRLFTKNKRYKRGFIPIQPFLKEVSPEKSKKQL